MLNSCFVSDQTNEAEGDELEQQNDITENKENGDDKEGNVKITDVTKFDKNVVNNVEKSKEEKESKYFRFVFCYLCFDFFALPLDLKCFK